MWLRVYPHEFGDGLCCALDGWRPQPSLRQKKALNPRDTDVQIFASLSLGDVWSDAELIECYHYLRKGSTSIPPSWEGAFRAFDKELARSC